MDGTNQTDSVQKLLTRVTEGEATALKLVKDLGGDGVNGLVIERRKLNPEAPKAPEKIESPARKHVFYEATRFADYLLKYGTPDTVAFANPAHSTISAVLNERATKGFEVVIFEPMRHPRWEPWFALLGQSIGLGEFVDFLRENRKAVVEPEGRELVLTLSQVKGSSETTLHQGKGKRSLNGLIVKTNIQGQKGDEFVELPEALVVELPIFVGTKARRVELDLCLEMGQGPTGLPAVVANLNSADIREAEVQGFEDAVAALEEITKAGADDDDQAVKVTVAYGSPQYANWNYLK